MNNDVELIPVKGVLPSVQVQLDNVIYVPQAHKNKAGIVKEGDGVLIENGVVSLNKQTVEDMIDANKWVSYGFRQNLTKEEKGMARHNIGAGDNDFTGSYYDVTQKPHLNTDNIDSLDTGDEEINNTINLHKVSKTGSFDDLNDVPTDTLDFAESERQKSKNLCCLKNESETVAGVTMFYDSINQTIELNGTSTGDINIMPNIRNILPIISNSLGKTYTFTILIESGNFSNNFGAYLGSLDSDIWSDRFTLWVYKTDTSSSTTFTVSTNHTYDTLFVYLLNGTVVNNLKLKVQIEEGSVATNYQPYNGEIVHEKQISGLSNPNLLINGDFRVNQRGKTSYTGTGYTVDRWRNVGFNNLTVTPLVSGLRLEDAVDAGTGHVLSYKFEDKDYLKLQSKTITISFKVSKNTGSNIYLRLLANGEIVGNTNNTNNTGIFSTTITLPNSLNSLELQIRKSSGELNCEIEYVKLELGSVVTPFSPRPYAEELTMCQRYFQTINTVTSLLYARTNNQLRTMINFKTEMRTAPTLTQLNTIRVFGINEGTTFTQSSVGISGATATNREGAVVALSNYSGLTEKYIYQFDLGVSTEPIFTADAEIY